MNEETYQQQKKKLLNQYDELEQTKRSFMNNLDHLYHKMAHYIPTNSPNFKSFQTQLSNTQTQGIHFFKQQQQQLQEELDQCRQSFKKGKEEAHDRERNA